jgi:hypothetical protein
MDDLTAPEPAQPVQREPQPGAPAKKRRFGTARILLGVGALVAMALGGGIGASIVHGKTQHNKQVLAQARTAAKTDTKPSALTAGVSADGSHYGPLFAYLLPMPAGYALGPDYCGLGNNTAVAGSQISDETDILLCGQPQSDTSGPSLADVPIENLAVRTYSDTTASLVVQIALVQTDISDAAEESENFDSTLSDTTDYRQGPSIPGYSQATCALPPELGSDTLDSMICLALSGDVEVRVDAYGTAPLDQNAIAQLVSQQLRLLTTNQTIGWGGTR